MPKLMAQTVASERFARYGDRTRADDVDADTNAIADDRQVILSAIARRFSPVLRRNNFSLPRDFKRVVGSDDVLTIDIWRAGRLAATNAVRLGWHRPDSVGSSILNPALDSVIRLADPARADARWGFPVSKSPAGGAMDHMDLGNIAPEAPTFQRTWNRLASAGGARISGRMCCAYRSHRARPGTA